MVTPFANARLEYDFAKSNDPTVAANQTQPEDSNLGIRLGVGAEFEFAPNITGSMSCVPRGVLNIFVKRLLIRPHRWRHEPVQ